MTAPPPGPPLQPPGRQWIDATPKKPRTVPLWGTVLTGIIAFLVGMSVGNAGDSSSELADARERIRQLEAEPAPADAPATPPEAAAPATTKAASAQGAAVTLSGGGEMKSKKVRLSGDYAVAWKTEGSCYYSADLEDTEGGFRGETVFNADEKTSGAGYVYGLREADYYVDVITGPAPGCGWSVTLTPAP